MSTLAQQPQVQAGGPVAGQSSPGTGNSLTQISAGPAALAQLMIYEAMALYAKIIKLQAEQKINMVDAQVKATEAQSEETISEGKAALSAAIYSGVFTGIAAAGQLVTFGVLQKTMNKGSSQKMSELKGETTPMESVEKSLTAKPDPVAGEKVEDNVSKLAKQFKQGNYKGAKDIDETTAAVRKLKSGDDPNFDYDKWEGNFRTELDNKRKQMQQLTQIQNTTANYSQMGGSMISSLFQGASTIAQGAGSNAQKTHSAAATLDGTASQIAGSASSDAGQAMGKASQSLDSMMQVLDAINRANNVN